MKYIEGFRNADAGKQFAREIAIEGVKLATQNRVIRLMEVCGSHTMAISRYGIRDILPDNIELLSGPGCPVCVTDAAYIDAAIELASRGHIISTFGDMIKVPGSEQNLALARSDAADVRVCYSPLESIELAKDNPDREVVFLAIGFETTMAPLTTLIPRAVREGVDNFSLLTAFKLVPPALFALLSDPAVNVDGFICPAHVSTIIGSDAYRPIVEKHSVPCVICGFEPLDILYGIKNLANQLANDRPVLENQYSRVVKPQGNKTAQKLIETYLEPTDASWRGIGIIPQSGLVIRQGFSKFDASIKFSVSTEGGEPDINCRCGDVLRGTIRPSDCPMFGSECTPANPVGPCMVSSEGSCAAHYKYAR